jgi:hypothetical protein
MTETGWSRTRELFTDWSAGCSRSDSEVSRALMDIKWRGLSFWWMTNLVIKDSSVNFDWFVKIHRRISGLPDGSGFRAVRRPGVLRLLRLCLADLLRWSLMRASFRAAGVPNVNVWFLSIVYNLVRDDAGKVYDRNFSDTPHQDAKHGARAGYLVWFMSALPRFDRILSWRRTAREMLHDTGRDCVVVDRYLSFTDVLACHWAAARALGKIRKWRRSDEARALAHIDGYDCSDILYDELEASFLGSVQQTMQFASALAGFFAKARSRSVVVTYGEILGPMRAIYHQAAQVEFPPTFIAVQHAMLCENKLGAYHRRTEFAHAGEPTGTKFSPAPGMFLVQGPQYRKILERFFPEDAIRTIGSLKYDKWADRIRVKQQTRHEIRERLGVGARRLLVIAPSVNDDKEICRILAGVYGLNGWMMVALPHPVVGRESLKKSLQEFGLADDVQVPQELTMPELIAAADLVLCGISTVAIEAAAFHVPSVRAIEDDVFPQFPSDSMIPCFSDPCAFRAWLLGDFKVLTQTRTPADYNRIVDNYFHALDGGAATRLWVQIERFLPLNITRSC